MHTTVEDVRFYEAKLARQPKWWWDYKARMKVNNPVPDYDIDRIVNGHARLPTAERRLEAVNTLNLIRTALKRGEQLESTLLWLAGSSIKRRASFAQKWWVRAYFKELPCAKTNGP